MSNYRRARVPGASYFFTVNLRDRRSDLLVREIDRFHAHAWERSPRRSASTSKSIVSQRVV